MSLKNFFKLRLLPNDFPPLHGLRFVAVMGVLQNHCATALIAISFAMHTRSNDFAFMLRYVNTWYAMDVFFILSGFLIGSMLLATPNLNSTKNLVRYYLRRFLRIIPLYYIFLVAYSYLHTHVPLFMNSDININWPRELSFLTNYPYSLKMYLVPWSWSLSLEEHFYFLAPAVVFLVIWPKSGRNRALMFFGLWSFSVIVRFVEIMRPVHWSNNDIYTKLFTPTHARFDIIILGVLLAYFHHYYRERLVALANTKGVTAAITYLPPLILLALMFYHWSFVSDMMDPSLANREPNKTDLFMAAVSFGPITGIAFLALILRLCYVEGRLKTLFSHPFCRIFVTLGYGIYLVHEPVLYTMIYSFVPHVMNGHYLLPICMILVSAVFAVSMVVAYFTHIFIEKPFLALRDRFF